MRVRVGCMVYSTLLATRQFATCWLVQESGVALSLMVPRAHSCAVYHRISQSFLVVLYFCARFSSGVGGQVGECSSAPELTSRVCVGTSGAFSKSSMQTVADSTFDSMIPGCSGSGCRHVQRGNSTRSSALSSNSCWSQLIALSSSPTFIIDFGWVPRPALELLAVELSCAA